MSEHIKRKQLWLLYCIIGFLSITLIIVFKLWLSNETVSKNQKQTVKKKLTTGASRISPQEAWVHDFTHKAEVTQKRMEALEQTLETLIKLNAKPETETPTSLTPTPVGNLRTEIINSIESSHEIPHREDIQSLPMQPQNTTQVILRPHSTKGFKSKTLKKITLNLNNARQGSSLKTTDNNIPAGAFAEAVLLGGVDASTSIQASSDPRPILLRLTDPGTLPRRFKSDLDGCHVLAASFGDISSERVFMRLEKLSCVERKTGEILEMSIQGYVAGEDGRAGIRGSIVDRAGASMRNAMVGGFFSSVGKFLGQARSPLLFSPTTGIAEQNPLSTNDILKQSAGNGMSGALDKYADFYIKRAEQMQPVIQIAAGRKVDIVFTQGFDFSDSALRKMLAKTHDQKRFQQVQLETQSPDTSIPNHEGAP